MKSMKQNQNKQKMKTYPSAEEAVKAAQKRGDKQITVKFTKPSKGKK